MSAVFPAETLTGGAYLILHLRTFEGNMDHAYDDKKIHSLREGLGKCMKEWVFPNFKDFLAFAFNGPPPHSSRETLQ